ncbi:hypothetical protein NDA11_005828 [Ustilago hordei]|uniref:Uncharacterized protein n=1 Tax=Ustilago hordei TaxID=120017 RepID=I2FSQ8_USTHO|nr:hypothetical protein NDA10_003347 [Ustilago hordei]KAJ1570937.1 hypothetical protein NDA11_005828 [Ustilago hordei]KAJ1586963.1 hypothetical protein NDA15_000498 [Ustilago hordei]KAJ1590039.1 hypothetical protein NDA12_003477 [Ustilago hordei]UTT96658.1 hypothetical protein NDA17_007596 [Ustilago hordei]
MLLLLWEASLTLLLVRGLLNSTPPTRPSYPSHPLCDAALGLHFPRALWMAPTVIGAGCAGERHPITNMTRGGYCHRPECTGSMKAVGSYGRSTGTRGQITEEDDHSRSRGGRADARGLAGTSSRHGQSAASMETMDMEDRACMQGGPSTATRRTELKEAYRGLPLRGSRDKSQRNCHWSKEEEQC